MRLSDPHIPAEWASDEILEENAVICEIVPADWQHPNKRCPICGQKECDCQAKLVSSQRSFTTVLCCWNCRHRIHGGRGSRGNGLCDLAGKGGLVPPDGHCDQHGERP